MPAKELKINLLGQDALDHTPWGRLIMWATTYGRYIMITTEIIVLLAFISRFSLDRKLTDATEEITQKQAIIEANKPFEEDIRSLQAQITQIKTLLAGQEMPIDVMTLIIRYLPSDVYLESYELSGNKISVSATAATNEGFSLFLARLNTANILSNVTIGDIRRTAATGIQFQFTATLPTTKTN